jgi:hypothetical protein
MEEADRQQAAGRDRRLTLDRALQCLQAGADSAAVVGDIVNNPDPIAQARAWIDATRVAAMTDRYARQRILAEVGAAGQARLAAASVLVVGAGGLGCPVLQYLAGAGVGRLTVVDHDTVEETNLIASRFTPWPTSASRRSKPRARACCNSTPASPSTPSPNA